MTWEDLREATEKASEAKGPKCGVKVFLEEVVPAEDRKSVQEVIEDPSIQIAGLRRELAKRAGDKAPQPGVIARHRRAECVCRREG